MHVFTAPPVPTANNGQLMNNGKADTTLQDLQKLQQQLQDIKDQVLMIFIYYLCLLLVSYLLLKINKNSSHGRAHLSGIFQ